MVGSWRWKQTCTHTNTHMHINTHTNCIHTYTRTYTCTHLYTHMHKLHTHKTHSHVCILTINTYINAYKHTHLHTQAGVHTCTNIHKHAHIYMHIPKIIIINLSGPRCVTSCSQIEYILVLISGDHAYTYIIMYLDYTRQPQRLQQLGILHGKFYTALWVMEQISIQLIDVRGRMVYQ